VQFRTPYAVASWADGDQLELLAISHWREEAAIPIRFLYPTDLGLPSHQGPEPEGNESTIRVRVPLEQGDELLQALVDACNSS